MKKERKKYYDIVINLLFFEIIKSILHFAARREEKEGKIRRIEFVKKL